MLPTMWEVLDQCEIPGEIHDYLIDEHIDSTQGMLQIFHRDKADFERVLESVGIQASQKEKLVTLLQTLPVPQSLSQSSERQSVSKPGFSSPAAVQCAGVNPTDEELDEAVGMHAGAARKMRNS